MFGSHLLRFDSKTQATIALSSGESETFAAIRAGTEALGMITLMKDMGREITATLRLDASAALGMLQRKGVRKIRHLDAGFFCGCRKRKPGSGSDWRKNPVRATQQIWERNILVKKRCYAT